MVFHGLYFRRMPLRLDQLLCGAVLDVDSVDGKSGDVVGDLVRIIGIAVLDVQAGVAVQWSQGDGQAEIRLLGRPVAVGPAKAGCDAEARRADRRETTLQQRQRRRHIPRVGQQQWQLAVVQVLEGHPSLHGVTGRSWRQPSTITSTRSSKKQIRSRTGSASWRGS